MKKVFRPIPFLIFLLIAACSDSGPLNQKLIGTWELQLSDKLLNKKIERFSDKKFSGEMRKRLRKLVSQSGIQIQFFKNGQVEIRDKRYSTPRFVVRIFKGTFSVKRNVLKIIDKKSSRVRLSKVKFISRNRLKIVRKKLSFDMEFSRINNFTFKLDEKANYALAVLLAKRSLQIAEKSVDANHFLVAISLNKLASLYQRQGKYKAAESMYKRAVAINKAQGNYPAVARTLDNLGNFYYSQGKYKAAEPIYKRALAINEALGNLGVATNLNNLATLYVRQGKYKIAEPMYKRALAITEKALGPSSEHVYLSLINLAFLYERQGKYKEAEPLVKRALAINEKALGPKHALVATDLNNLASLYKSQGKYKLAEPMFKRALTIREKEFGLTHPTVATTLSNLATLYRKTNRSREAKVLEQRAKAIRAIKR